MGGATAATITVCSSGCNYISIQAAVDAASDGDTVSVGAGTYTENVDINKSINLIGAGADVTVINASNPNDHVIEIKANFINISGFTVMSGKGFLKAGIAIFGNNSRIYGNILFDIEEFGIYITSSSYNSSSYNNSILNNTFNSIRNAIEIYGPTNGNNVSLNRITEAETGIVIFNSSYNFVDGNAIANITLNGILISAGSSKNTIIRNTVTNVEGDGIDLSNTGDENYVLSNDIYNTSWDGISLSGNHNYIQGNTIKKSRYGISLLVSINSTISNNSIENCTKGIYIQNTNHSIINSNNISNSSSEGLVIYGRTSYYNKLFRNTFKYNSIGLRNLYSTFNIIYHNNFLDNVVQAYDNGIGIWDSGYPGGGNYWSDWTSPDTRRGEGQNQTCGGDGIVDNPYNIGGGNLDRYPFTTPKGWELPTAAPCGGETNEIEVEVPVTFKTEMLAQNGVAMAQIVVGANDPGRATDVATAYQIKDTVQSFLGPSLDIVEENGADRSMNLVLIGGPVANALVADLVTKGKSKIDWYISPGDIEIIPDAFTAGKYAIIVGGNDRDATRMAADALIDAIKSPPTTNLTHPHIQFTWYSDDLDDDGDASDDNFTNSWDRFGLKGEQDQDMIQLTASNFSDGGYVEIPNGLRVDADADGDLNDSADYVLYNGMYILDASSGDVQFGYTPIMDETYNNGTLTRGNVIKIRGSSYVLTDADFSDNDAEMGPAITATLTNFSAADPDNATVVDGSLKIMAVGSLLNETELYLYDGSSLLEIVPLGNENNTVYDLSGELASDEFKSFKMYAWFRYDTQRVYVTMAGKAQLVKVSNDEEGVMGYSRIKVGDPEFPAGGGQHGIILLGNPVTLVRGDTVDLPDTELSLKLSIDRRLDILRKRIAVIQGGTSLDENTYPGSEFLKTETYWSASGGDITITYWDDDLDDDGDQIDYFWTASANYSDEFSIIQEIGNFVELSDASEYGTSTLRVDGDGDGRLNDWEDYPLYSGFYLISSSDIQPYLNGSDVTEDSSIDNASIFNGAKEDSMGLGILGRVVRLRGSRYIFIREIDSQTAVLAPLLVCTATDVYSGPIYGIGPSGYKVQVSGDLYLAYDNISAFKGTLYFYENSNLLMASSVGGITNNSETGYSGTIDSAYLPDEFSGMNMSYEIPFGNALINVTIYQNGTVKYLTVPDQFINYSDISYADPLDYAVTLTGTLKVAYDKDTGMNGTLYFYDGSNLLKTLAIGGASPNDGSSFIGQINKADLPEEFTGLKMFYRIQPGNNMVTITAGEKSQGIEIFNGVTGAMGYNTFYLWLGPGDNPLFSRLQRGLYAFGDPITLYPGEKVDLPDTYYSVDLDGNVLLDVLRKDTVSVSSGSKLKETSSKYRDFLIKMIIVQVLDYQPPIIDFVTPTDPDEAVLTDRDWTFINVTLSEPGTAWLEWNGLWEDMIGGGTWWYVNKTGLSSGSYTYKVWAEDLSGNSNVTPTRKLEIKPETPPPTVPPVTTTPPQPPSSSTTLGTLYIAGEGGHLAVINLGEFIKDTANYIAKRVKPKGLKGGSETAGVLAGMNMGEMTGEGMPDRQGGTHGAALLNDRETLVVGTLGGQVYEVNVKTGATAGPIDVGQKFCDARLGPDGRVYLEDTANGNIYIYDPATDIAAGFIPTGNNNEVVSSVCGVDWLDDGTMLITDMPTGTVYHIDANGNILGNVTVGTFIHQAALTPDKKEFWVSAPDEFNIPVNGLEGWSINPGASGGHKPGIVIIDPSTLKMIKRIETPDLYAHDIEFTPDGKYALISARDYADGGWLTIMDARTYKVIHRGEICKSCHLSVGVEPEAGTVKLGGIVADFSGYVSVAEILNLSNRIGIQNLKNGSCIEVHILDSFNEVFGVCNIDGQVEVSSGGSSRKDLVIKIRKSAFYSILNSPEPFKELKIQYYDNNNIDVTLDDGKTHFWEASPLKIINLLKQGYRSIYDRISKFPELVSPPENRTIFSRDVIFRFFTADSQASSVNYNLSIDGVVNTSGSAINGGFTTAVVRGLPKGSHNWSITVWNNLGISNSSETRNFTIRRRFRIPPRILRLVANKTTRSGFVNLTQKGVPSEFVEDIGVIGYEYAIRTKGKTPPVNLSVDIMVEPRDDVTNISKVKGAIPGFYYRIKVNDSSWFKNVSEIQLKIYYDNDNLNLPSRVYESTLRPMRFTNGTWMRLDCDTLGGCPATLADGTRVYGAGVVTSSQNATPYVWANLSNFSYYGLGGLVEEDGQQTSSGGGGGGGTLKGTVIKMVRAGERAVAVLDLAVTGYISEIVLTPRETLHNLWVTAEALDEKPYPTMPDPEGTVLSYFKLMKSGIADTQLEGSEINFQVPVSWLMENDINQGRVHMQRNAANAWETLETTYLSEDDEFAYYSALALGFSYFVITGDVGSGYRKPEVTEEEVSPPLPITTLPTTAGPPLEEPTKTPVEEAMIGPTSETEEEKGICGPTLLIVLALVPLLGRFHTQD
jgi:PGF-pre-PGF domain-containing protein